jgi:dihydroorotate dehydrogenase (NAD+) catalytic subunit
MVVMAQMQVQIGKVTLRNPVVLAAGTSGVMGEIKDAINLSSLGAITTKSITKEPRIGNDPIRMSTLENGMVNAIGLANEGIHSFIKNQAPIASQLDTTVIGSIAGDTIAGYVEVAQAMNDVEAIELAEVNVSCPNTSDGLEFGGCPNRLTELLKEIRPALSNTGMIVKLSAAPGDIRLHAQAAIDSGADALTLINTIPSLVIDIESRKPKLSRGVGGLSGAVIHPVAVRVVHDIYTEVTKDAGIPIIGTGGVMCWEDAAEFITAGATAVGIGTASFINPAIAPKIANKLSSWTKNQGCSSITELVGSLQLQ